MLQVFQIFLRDFLQKCFNKLHQQIFSRISQDSNGILPKMFVVILPRTPSRISSRFPPEIRNSSTNSSSNLIRGFLLIMINIFLIFQNIRKFRTSKETQSRYECRLQNLKIFVNAKMKQLYCPPFGGAVSVQNSDSSENKDKEKTVI